MNTNLLLLILLVLICSPHLFANAQLPTGTRLAILLTGNNLLVVPADVASPTTGTVVSLTGLSGEVKGIDVRPATGVLYAVTDVGAFYTIDTTTGVATLASAMKTLVFNGGRDWGFDFNPTVDRARLVGYNGQNARYNVDTGDLVDYDPNTPGTQQDKSLAYASSPCAGCSPHVVAAAYNNSRAGVTTTTLFDFDRTTLALYSQAPPNDGVLNRLGATGVSGVIRRAGFDIYTDASSVNYAVLATTNRKFYSVNLLTGAATQIYSASSLLNVLGRVRSLAILPPSS